MKHRGGEVFERWLREVGAGPVIGALAECVGDAAVFFVDGQKRILHWSRGAERLLGYSSEEVVGEHCLKANRCEQCIQGCGLENSGSVSGFPLEMYRSDGRAVRVKKTSRGFFDEDGVFLGGVEVLVPDEGRGGVEVAAPNDGRVAVFHGFASSDPEMQLVFETCRNVAETDASVLVRGESGTGKELLARALHEESPRRKGPFIAVNCAALPATLVESELFGHSKGAFTGAVGSRMGLFREADGGTLFLDEVAELPLEMQAKLLRVLQERVVVPVGSSKGVPVDVRVIAATHQSLRGLVNRGSFREDLMFRLRVVPIFIPPLRERRGDVEALLWRFIEERNALGQRVARSVAPDAMRALLDHPWPGNVRELKNVVDYAFAVERSSEIGRDELPPELREVPLRAPSPTPAPIAVRGRDEESRIREAIEASGGHLGKAAEMLGVSRPTLWRKRRRYGI